MIHGCLQKKQLHSPTAYWLLAVRCPRKLICRPLKIQDPLQQPLRFYFTGHADGGDPATRWLLFQKWDLRLQNKFCPSFFDKTCWVNVFWVFLGSTHGTAIFLRRTWRRLSKRAENVLLLTACAASFSPILSGCVLNQTDSQGVAVDLRNLLRRRINGLVGLV